MNEILSEGLALMLIGMGTVLCFLCTLILSMNVMSFCVGKLNEWFPEIEVTTGGSKKVATAGANNDEAIAVAIAAVVAKK